MLAHHRDRIPLHINSVQILVCVEGEIGRVSQDAEMFAEISGSFLHRRPLLLSGGGGAGEGGGEGPGVVPVRHLVVRREIVEVVEAGVPTQVVRLRQAGVLARGAQDRTSEQEDGEDGGNHRDWFVRLTLSQLSQRIYTPSDMLVLPPLCPHHLTTSEKGQIGPRDSPSSRPSPPAAAARQPR